MNLFPWELILVNFMLFGQKSNCPSLQCCLLPIPTILSEVKWINQDLNREHISHIFQCSSIIAVIRCYNLPLYVFFSCVNNSCTSCPKCHKILKSSSAYLVKSMNKLSFEQRMHFLQFTHLSLVIHQCSHNRIRTTTTTTTTWHLYHAKIK